LFFHSSSLTLSTGHFYLALTGHSHVAAQGVECRLTLGTFLTENEAIMLASLHANRSEGGADCVTNSVTNPLGIPGAPRQVLRQVAPVSWKQLPIFAE